MTPAGEIVGQLPLDVDARAREDDLSDLDLDHARRVLAEEEITIASARPCVCTHPLVFASALGAGTCGFCGREPARAAR